MALPRSPPPKECSRSLILVVVTIGSFLNPFTGSSINLALPLIGEEFAVNAIILSWIPAAYLLSTAIFLLPAGMLGDIAGRGRVFSWGTLIYTVASALTIFVPSASALLVLRFLQGIGSAMLFGTAVAIIAELYPPGERGRALGINVTAIYAGLTLGPFFGGLLTQFFGWRSIFLVTVFLGVVVLLQVSRFPALLDEPRRYVFDWAGACLSALILILFSVGVSRVPDPASIGLIGASALTVIIFLAVENRRPQPLFPITLLRENRVFSFSNLAALINYSATFAVTFLMSLYLQVVRGMSPAAAGSVLLIQPFCQMICSPLAGRLSDRTDPSLLASSGMAVSSLCLLSLAFLGETTSTGIIALILAALGIGLGLFSAPNTTVIMGSVERHDYTLASSMVATMRNSGMMMSMAIVMIFFALLLGDAPITPDVSGQFLASMHLILLVFSLLTLIGAFISWNRGRLPGTGKPS
ncbi:MAG: MFS transporter [Methanomicrobiales archaeon]|nr:MFS transporter [Methanomicrobiales archaeon]NYT21228.1 MFS transporter [Methanomicrobiales archaeon]